MSSAAVGFLPNPLPHDKVPTVPTLRASTYYSAGVATNSNHFSRPPMDFVINSESRTRGHNFKITKQPCNTFLRQKFFAIRVVDSWNNLNQIIVNAKSMDSFKTLIDKEFKDLMYRTNTCHPVLLKSSRLSISSRASVSSIQHAQCLL